MWFEVPVPDVDECEDVAPFDARGKGAVSVEWKQEPTIPCKEFYVLCSAHKRIGPVLSEVLMHKAEDYIELCCISTGSPTQHTRGISDYAGSVYQRQGDGSCFYLHAIADDSFDFRTPEYVQCLESVLDKLRALNGNCFPAILAVAENCVQPTTLSAAAVFELSKDGVSLPLPLTIGGVCAGLMTLFRVRHPDEMSPIVFAVTYCEQHGDTDEELAAICVRALSEKCEALSLNASATRWSNCTAILSELCSCRRTQAESTKHLYL